MLQVCVDHETGQFSTINSEIYSIFTNQRRYHVTQPCIFSTTQLSAHQPYNKTKLDIKKRFLQFLYLIDHHGLHLGLRNMPMIRNRRVSQSQ